MIRLDPRALAAMTEHARASYPEECCGALFARTEGEARDVLRAVPAGNARETERARRYLIGPDTLQELEAQAAETGLEVVGFYHSHPDHPAEPSAFDVEHAWPWYSYIILPVSGGDVGAPRAWRLRDDRSGFDAEDLTLNDRGAGR
jgi:proteasome lid subunit RPN8/RPN11